MNARKAYARLRGLGVPVLDTADAAAALELSTDAASHTLTRLAEAGLVTSVRHGSWWIDGKIDPYRLPEYLTAPLPSYLSLQTALHLRGLIEQVPEVFYAVSLARTERIATRVGTFSIHHVSPASAYCASFPNFSQSLQRTHGLGVRPRLYSETK